MGCLFGVLSLITPRLVLIVMWVTEYTSRAFESWFLPTLGFLILPATTVAYAIAENELSRRGEIELLGIIVIVVGVLLDLGLLGSGARARRRRRHL
jgi:hypothetical protein